jgi:hypothetical protein
MCIIGCSPRIKFAHDLEYKSLNKLKKYYILFIS